MSVNEAQSHQFKTPEELEGFGQAFSKYLCNGDVVLLNGPIGSGKTTFCRGVIRGKFDDDEMIVTSPSYLLDNGYNCQETGNSIHHMDLYRLPKGVDLSFLGIPEIFDNSVCLIEWPERMNDKQKPKTYLEINFYADDNFKERRLSMKGHGDYWMKKLLSITNGMC